MTGSICTRWTEARNAYRILIMKLLGKQSFVRPGQGPQDNSELYLENTDLGNENWLSSQW
jgi:hypothetical protein